MAKSSLAHPEHKTTRDYVDKGRRLFEERFDEFVYLGRGVCWLIPSTTTEGKRYEASTRHEGFCECIGWGFHHHCSHQVAADLARIKTEHCAFCGGRFLYRDLHPLEDDHYLGLVCRRCS
jgi:hypothetical protein